jgi:short-subunit dehydrogenase
MKSAVVTGAGSGLGRAIAQQLAGRGWALALVGKTADKLEQVKRSFSPVCPKAAAYPGDLAEDGHMNKLIEALKADFPQVDLLLHSAGIFERGSIESTPVQIMDVLYRVNVRAPYLLTQALLPCLLERQGQVVFINSSSGLTARENLSQYSATKHGLKAIADGLRGEVNAAGVRVVSVFLGQTATPMQERIHSMEGKTYHREKLIQPEDAAEIIIRTIECPASAEITDIRIRSVKKPDS